MNRTLVLVSALGAGLMTAMGAAQTPAAPAPAASAPQTSTVPEAIPAKIALVAFEQAVFATNEGQLAVQNLQKKYQPQKSHLDELSAEVDSLKKQLQSAPATLSDEERQNRLRNIDTKEKQLNRDSEDATNAYNAELQDVYGKVAAKVSVTLKKYVQDNGYTLLLDVGSQQSNVMWATPNTNTDVTEAVVNAYNASSGVAAPMPSAPSAPSAARPRSTTTTPRATTTPHTTTPPQQ
jgi:Skp family chaperone for outer membrane proteins